MGEPIEHPPRIAPRAPTALRIHYRNAEQFLVSYCTNISRGGVFVRTDVPLEPGSRMNLVLGIPGIEEERIIDAEVRWVRQSADAYGPAGMGLGFEEVDESLGEIIDRVISLARPLKIDLVAPNDLSSRHLGALVQSLVACRVRHHDLRPSTSSRLKDSDLVIVDVDAYQERAIEFMGLLARTPESAPTLALCSKFDNERHDKAGKFARVVATPVDPNDFQSRVLDTLCDVTGHQVETSLRDISDEVPS